MGIESIITVSLAIFTTSYATAQNSICLGVNCPADSAMEQIDKMHELQIQRNIYLFQGYLGAQGFNFDDEEHKKCILVCKEIAEERKKNCTEVYITSNPHGADPRGYDMCLEAVKEGHSECLAPSLIECNG